MKLSYGPDWNDSGGKISTLWELAVCRCNSYPFALLKGQHDVQFNHMFALPIPMISDWDMLPTPQLDLLTPDTQVMDLDICARNPGSCSDPGYQ